MQEPRMKIHRLRKDINDFRHELNKLENQTQTLKVMRAAVKLQNQEYQTEVVILNLKESLREGMEL